MQRGDFFTAACTTICRKRRKLSCVSHLRASDIYIVNHGIRRLSAGASLSIIKNIGLSYQRRRSFDRNFTADLLAPIANAFPGTGPAWLGPLETELGEVALCRNEVVDCGSAWNGSVPIDSLSETEDGRRGELGAVVADGRRRRRRADRARSATRAEPAYVTPSAARRRRRRAW